MTEFEDFDNFRNGFESIKEKYASCIETVVLPGGDSELCCSSAELLSLLSPMVNLRQAILYITQYIGGDSDDSDDLLYGPTLDLKHPSAHSILDYDYPDIFNVIGTQLTSLTINSGENYSSDYRRVIGPGLFYIDTSIVVRILVPCINLTHLSLSMMDMNFERLKPFSTMYKQSQSLVGSLQTMTQLKHLKIEDFKFDKEIGDENFFSGEWSIPLESISITNFKFSGSEKLSPNRLHRFLNQFSTSLNHLSLFTKITPQADCVSPILLNLPLLSSLSIDDRNFDGIGFLHTSPLKKLLIRWTSEELPSSLKINFLNSLLSIKNLEIDTTSTRWKREEFDLAELRKRLTREGLKLNVK